ncbi:MAG: aconitate hydratase AcnA [Proteobacteria bacterium]|nr:aconitate hydratase AcnA [Pseudomonadota bacterium]
MPLVGHDSLGTRRTLEVDGRKYDYFSLKALEDQGLGEVSRLPVSLKVLLENLLRFEDGRTVTVDDIKAVIAWLKEGRSEKEIAYRPARVLMQDFTGVPAIADLAAMREAMVAMGGDPRRINPLSPVDLVIDHSVMVDVFGSAGAFKKNVEMEYARNGERYAFMRWGQKAFDNFRVVPPGTGICHQVNLEYLGQGVWLGKDDRGRAIAYPDTCFGTDSHTTMINGLGVLGWGVGGIEAEAAMLGQPISMLIPEVVGFKMTGDLREGTTATDLVLTVTQMLRKFGVVGKFVEFFGPGLAHLALADRATIGNMSPEYGATCGFFPIDAETVRYMGFTGRDPHRVRLAEAYARAQGMWRDAGSAEPVFTDVLELDLAAVEPSISGPKRPQDRIALAGAGRQFAKDLAGVLAVPKEEQARKVKVRDHNFELGHGDIVIAAITSCTNTSNPSVLVGAGLVARKAREKGLSVKPWVKTSLAPGSQVVTDYLEKAGLQTDLDALGFNLVGGGCTTCIGNSGPLDEDIADAIEEGKLVACAVLSGNRNFEGRIHPFVRANYLASPPLVVAYALAGSMRVDLSQDPLGTGKDGKPVYLKDIWPSNREVAETLRTALTPEMFRSRYADVFAGDAMWRTMATPEGGIYDWNIASTYVKRPPFFEDMPPEPAPVADIRRARVLVMLADTVTTDHISPAGSIKAESPAGSYLVERQVQRRDFNSFGARRGNHEVMMRGTFGNVRLRNELVPGVEGGFTRHLPDGTQMTIFEAALRYQEEGVPLVVIAGKEYGAGSSRDWAAKGTRLLGVRAAIAESFERIHRSNLVGMGVLPLQFKDGMSRKSLGLDGTELFDITGIAGGIKPRMDVACTITRADGSKKEITLRSRIDTLDEVEYYRHGGILQYVLRSMMAEAA